MECSIIHLNKNNFPKGSIQYLETESREKNVIEQLNSQGIFYHRWVDAIYDKQIPFRGCCKSHKKAVQFAKDHNLPQITICEDDIIFTKHGAFGTYLKNMPIDFDLYLGGIYNLKGEGGTLDNGKVVDYFCGMSLYTVNSRFYDFFLGLNELNNIDRELSKTTNIHKYIVCNPMVVYQKNGYSFIRRETVNRDEYLPSIGVSS